MHFFSKGLHGALEFLHKHHVTHCDLKLDNIVVRLQQSEEPFLQLIDLGLSGRHGAGTGFNRLIAFFPESVVKNWSCLALDKFAAIQWCLHLYVSHKCPGSKKSMWRKLDHIYKETKDSDPGQQLFRVIGELFTESSRVDWLTWLRSVALDPNIVLRTQNSERWADTWTKFCGTFTVNDEPEVAMLNMVDGLFPFSH
jgi:serine/threonine protein kinase